MAKIYRVSGYMVEKDEKYNKEDIEFYLEDFFSADGECWQQLHLEESESFELDGEDKENCDLALLTRHFKKDATDMQFDRPLPVKGQKYRHFKLGKIVTVIGASVGKFRKTREEAIAAWNTRKPVEKVVEQLEEMSDDIPIQYENNYEQGVDDGIEKAIEIVKQISVGTDDACEWESDYKIISDKYKRVTGCGYEFYDLHHAVPFKYCPHCGKKIKVVE